MSRRIRYAKVAPKALESLGAPGTYLATASIPAKLRHLIELRVSQINGCAYCVDKHVMEARAAGETQQRLDCLIVWRETTLFDEKERAALQWAEAVTALAPDHVSDASFDEVRRHYSELEVVDLTVIVAMMNAWNRLAISMRTTPPVRQVG
ncbi:MAG TPA: carboxymuconolactone decarboxylase family protein [Tepidisphaeraceae bacterium]|jgi:AhpD family alkylhydroperoxidase|nr:carboxymuconolactone decarboxylase family protein [Tepidisphaeraceae bacterium]